MKCETLSQNVLILLPIHPNGCNFFKIILQEKVKYNKKLL